MNSKLNMKARKKARLQTKTFCVNMNGCAETRHHNKARITKSMVTAPTNMCIDTVLNMKQVKEAIS